MLMFTGRNAGKAEEAIDRYTSISEPASVKGILRYAAGEGDVEGIIKDAQFTLRRPVMIMMDRSAPSAFTFNDGISLVVLCDTREQLDYHWDQLSAVGEESICE